MHALNVLTAGVPLLYFAILFRHRKRLCPPRGADPLEFDMQRMENEDIAYFRFLWEAYVT